MNTPDPEVFDCIVVGGGPAGLLAATYLARFRRRVLVVDAGEGRALRIPRIRNCPGFPEGISGSDLVARLRQQAGRYGVRSVEGRVASLERGSGGFVAHCGVFTPSAPRVLLAPGVVDIVPELPEIAANLARQALRLCPVCDGYEAIDKTIAVIGCSEHALREAIFLKTYSPHVSLLVHGPDPLPDPVRAAARQAGIAVVEAVDELGSGSDGYEAIRAGGVKIPFDVIYPALGCHVRRELATQLDVRCNEDGHIRVGPRQQTSVEGVYAAGDVVHSLNQIAVAFGQAATAATAIHKSLAAATTGDPQHSFQATEGGASTA